MAWVACSSESRCLVATVNGKMGLSRIPIVPYLGSIYSRCINWNTQGVSPGFRRILASKGVIHYMREVVLLVSLPPSGGRHFGVHNLMVIGCAFLVTIRH